MSSGGHLNIFITGSVADFSVQCSRMGLRRVPAYGGCLTRHLEISLGSRDLQVQSDTNCNKKSELWIVRYGQAGKADVVRVQTKGHCSCTFEEDCHSSKLGDSRAAK